LGRLIQDALDERAITLPTYKRLAGYAISHEPLPRTAMAKIRRHKLPDLYERCLKERKIDKTQTIAVDSLHHADADLIASPISKQVLHCLARRYPGVPLTLTCSPQLDMGIDSLEWLDLTLELEDSVGVTLEQQALARVHNLRDLLEEVALAKHTSNHSAALFNNPEELLNEQDKAWIGPLTPAQKAEALALFWFNRALIHSLFRVKVKGLDNLKEVDQTVLAPNHASYLDPLVLCASLPFDILQRTQIAGWVGVAFANKVFAALSRLAQAIPIDSDRAMLSSIAMPIAVLKRGKNLIWFPEGRRTLTGNLLPLKPGLALVLENQPVSVTPVYLQGTADGLPPGKFLPRPAEITVIFGKPISRERLERMGTGETRQERILDGVAKAMQNLIDENTASGAIGNSCA
ncbi:MAG TPA: 1-acyl-sn-glycerol-3-phosphate acyltransferase, partial [Chroococcales cyanobacterium]